MITKKYALIFSLCFVPRLVYLLVSQEPVEPPSNTYWRLSDSLLQHGTLGFEGEKTTAFEPLYPLFLTLSRWITKDNFFFVLILQLGISSIGCVFFYKLSLALSGNRGVAHISAFLYSLYPYYIHQSVLLTEVSLLTTLLILTSCHYLKAVDLKGSLLCGLTFGLGILTRTILLPICLLGALVQILKRRFLTAALIVGSALFLVLPFLLRNHRLDGSLLPSRSGENLFKGNCEYSDRMIPAYSLDLLGNYLLEEFLKKERPDLLKASEWQIDRFFTQKATIFMKENPLRTLRLKLFNIAYLFYPRLVPFWPIAEETKLVFTEKGGIRVENAPSRGFIKE